jgi:phospholipase A1
MPFDFSTDMNVAPASENPDYTWTGDDLPLNGVEAKFQLSFKTKIAQGLIRGNGDL